MMTRVKTRAASAAAKHKATQSSRHYHQIDSCLPTSVYGLGDISHNFPCTNHCSPHDLGECVVLDV